MTASSTPDLGIGGYDELAEVARGGFGVVYRARQLEFDRTVAIKVLSGALDDRARQRFERERRAMGSLSNHPNIVTVYASGLTANNRPFVVMEYMAGGSLANRLEQGPVPPAEAVAVGIKLSHALDAAHKAGVLHRDIKPENVLISAYGEPMLADFGIARLEGGPETRSGVITASLGHAAPEILDGKRPTEAADVYSLASTIHTLVTGEAPFNRATDESIVPMLARIATEPPPDLRRFGVPGRVCDVIEAAMAKDPAQRIATAELLARSLDEARTAEGAEAGTGLVAPAPPPPHTVTVGAPEPRPAGGSLTGSPPESAAAAPLPVPSTGTPPSAGTRDRDDTKRRSVLRPVLAAVAGLLVGGLAGVAIANVRSPLDDEQSKVQALERDVDRAEERLDEQPGSIFTLSPGDCFTSPQDTYDIINMGTTAAVVENLDVSVVACSQLHGDEVIAMIPYGADGGGAFPGEDVLFAFGQEECTTAFADVVGVAITESSLNIANLYPTEESWAEGDREIVCVVYQDDDFTGSVEGTGR